MTNKTTHWVTIPEEAIHTPASKPSPKTGKMTPAGKFFWGAGFVIVIVITAALVAPKQMANLLQGNLFEQSGITPLNVVPTENPAAETTTTEQPAAEQPAETPTQPADVTVVQPETEAVTVQVEPVATEQPAPAETTTTGTTTPAVVTEQPVAETTEVAAGTTEVPGAIKDELDANRKLLEELSKQVTEFKEKDAEKTKIIEDLTGIVQDQTTGENLHPAPTETLPPAVTTTTALGQVPTGYKVNAHTVKITPYQALQQNTAQMETGQAGAYAGSVTQQEYNAQLARAQGTPESGPKEILLITMALTFAAMLGWKISKLARA